ncbi:hypothetical protein P2318_00935 [Myxococcaceae bacterium GXIMD 01537]
MKSELRVVVDVYQPGLQRDLGTYKNGPLIGRLTSREEGLP